MFMTITYVAFHKLIHVRTKAVDNLICQLASLLLYSPKALGYHHITYIVIIPNIQLRNLPIGRREWLRRVPIQPHHASMHMSYQVDSRRMIESQSNSPTNVVIQVILVAISPETFRERVFFSLLGIADTRPFAKRTMHTDSIVVDLVTTTDPWKRKLLVFPSPLPQESPIKVCRVYWALT